MQVSRSVSQSIKSVRSRALPTFSNLLYVKTLSSGVAQWFSNVNKNEMSPWAACHEFPATRLRATTGCRRRLHSHTLPLAIQLAKTPRQLRAAQRARAPLATANGFTAQHFAALRICCTKQQATRGLLTAITIVVAYVPGGGKTRMD
jgi:hypothetical protein